MLVKASVFPLHMVMDARVCGGSGGSPTILGDLVQVCRGALTLRPPLRSLRETKAHGCVCVSHTCVGILGLPGADSRAAVVTL